MLSVPLVSTATNVRKTSPTLSQNQLNKYNAEGSMAAQRIVLNKSGAINMHVPSNWAKFETILLARYEKSQDNMKLFKEQMNSFINTSKHIT